MSPPPVTALITGGSRGIGKAVALRLAKNTTVNNIVLLARNQTAASEAAAEIAHHAGQAFPTQSPLKAVGAVCTTRRSGSDQVLKTLGIACDVRSALDIRRAFLEIGQKLDGAIPTAVVNAAGVNIDSLLLKASDDNVQDMISTNLLGSIWVCRESVKQMVQKRVRDGSIVNVGSVVGLAGNSGQSVYSASKAGLHGLTRSLAKEVGRRNIRVNTVDLGYFKTDMTASLDEHAISKSKIALSRFGDPDEAAKVIEFVLLDASYMSGNSITVDGCLLP